VCIRVALRRFIPVFEFFKVVGPQRFTDAVVLSKPAPKIHQLAAVGAKRPHGFRKKLARRAAGGAGDGLAGIHGERRRILCLLRPPDRSNSTAVIFCWRCEEKPVEPTVSHAGAGGRTALGGGGRDEGATHGGRLHPSQRDHRAGAKRTDPVQESSGLPVGFASAPPLGSPRTAHGNAMGFVFYKIRFGRPPKIEAPSGRQNHKGDIIPTPGPLPVREAHCNNRPYTTSP